MRYFNNLTVSRTQTEITIIQVRENEKPQKTVIEPNLVIVECNENMTIRNISREEFRYILR